MMQIFDKSIIANSSVTFSFFFLLFTSCPTPAEDYHITISKQDNRLNIHTDDKIIKSYYVATGKGGEDNKIERGDNKTPTGIYRIIEFNKNSKFHYFIQINYPNMADAWHGYKNNLLTSDEFKEIISANRMNEMPPQDTAIGGYIGIHGIGLTNKQKLNIHKHQNWTEGCIALTNKEIDELKKYVKIGTKVIIME